MTEVQWDTTDLEATFEKVSEDFFSDLLPVSAFRMPSFYKILGSKNFVMGSNGFLQHPEVEGLAVEDYDAFIASPYNCIVERVLPRLYSELNRDPLTRSLVMAKAFNAFTDETGNTGRIYGNLIQKYGYGYTNFFAGFCEAPFDFLTDQLRGFKNISVDVRRIPDKVEAAVNAVTPLMIKMGNQPVPKNTMPPLFRCIWPLICAGKILTDSTGPPSRSWSMVWRKRECGLIFSLSRTGCAILIIWRNCLQVP